MVVDLAGLDATLRVFIRRPADRRQNGDKTRIILHVLGQPAEPMAARDIASDLRIGWALDNHDQRLLRLLTKRFGAALLR